MNKDKVVYTDKFNIDAEGKAEIPFKYQTSNNLYDKVPNGGVLVLKIRSTIKEDDIICENEDKKCIELLNAKEKKEELKRIEKEKRCGRWGCFGPQEPEEEKYLYTFERLIFLKPRSTLPFSITTDKQDYQPGDRVNVNVNFDPTLAKSIGKDERFFASITVTDTSSFL